jgi:hypothetical protein
MTTLEQPQYSPDLGPADFYLFTRLRSAQKGRRFCDASGIIKNAKEELKILSQTGFSEQLYNCWQKYIVVKRNILKGT